MQGYISSLDGKVSAAIDKQRSSQQALNDAIALMKLRQGLSETHFRLTQDYCKPRLDQAACVSSLVSVYDQSADRAITRQGGNLNSLKSQIQALESKGKSDDADMARLQELLKQRQMLYDLLSRIIQMEGQTKKQMIENMR